MWKTGDGSGLSFQEGNSARVGQPAIGCPKCSICAPYRELDHIFHVMNVNFTLINATFAQAAPPAHLSPFGSCQSYFQGTSIRFVWGVCNHGPKLSSTMHAVVPKFKELQKPAAPDSLGARGRSVSSWHGMPTASVRNKLFLL